MQQKQEEKPYKKVLDDIHDQVTSQSNKQTLDGAIFDLCTLIGGWGDITGREYEFIYNGDKIVGFRQKPIKMKSILGLFHELGEYNKRQEKMYKDNTPKMPRMRGR